MSSAAPQGDVENVRRLWVLPFFSSPKHRPGYRLTLPAMLAIDPLLTPWQPWGSIRHG